MTLSSHTLQEDVKQKGDFSSGLGIGRNSVFYAEIQHTLINELCSLKL